MTPIPPEILLQPRSEPIPLKGGHYTLDPRLDRIPSWDERNALFLVEPVTALPATKRVWGMPLYWNDQGREGACVAFGWSNEANCAPIQQTPIIENTYSSALYHWFQRHDEWPGENYDGTSVLAGAKGMKTLGYVGEYRWAQTVEEIASQIVNVGPVVVGTNWYYSMYYPSRDGKFELKPSGSIVGGHCYLLRGFYPANVMISLPNDTTISFPYPTFRIRNSWSQGWGINGDAFISVDAFRRLFNESGDACVPMYRRNRSPLPAVPSN